MDTITEVIFSVVDIMLYVAGVTLVIALVNAYLPISDHAVQMVNEKTNVWEVSGEIPDTPHTVSTASILSDILDAKENVLIKIDYHTLTEEDRKHLKQNDASTLLSLFQGNKTYEKSYQIENGVITAILYTPL